MSHTCSHIAISSVHHIGTKFEDRATTLESIDADETPDLDKQAGALRKDLDAAELSAALKSELRARIKAVQKKGIEAKKRNV